MSAISEGTESEEEEKAVSKSQCKHDKKISTQSSQIKDLRVKLDGAIAINMQIQELLNPATLQTAFTNALQASGKFRCRGKFFGKRQDPGFSAGIDGLQTQTSLAITAKTWVTRKITAYTCRNIMHFWQVKADLGKG